MGHRLFGTDGIRGNVMVYPITAKFMMQLGASLGNLLNKEITPGYQPLVIIGCDTRISCCMLEVPLVAGLLSRGISVELIGCLPTPAVAHLMLQKKAMYGVMISSSHNSYETNGIKFFNNQGYKFSLEQEEHLERSICPDEDIPMIKAGNGVCVKQIVDAEDSFIDSIKHSVEHLDLRGVKIVLDCANGAASGIAERLFSELGAHTTSINSAPNGCNINKNCGVLHVTDGICKAVVDVGASFGVALDGDGDRVVICDAFGNIACGDQLLAHIALNYQERGLLKNNGIVCTILSNTGLDNFMNKHNIEVFRSPVGERKVIEIMLQKDLKLGGENSGHIIMGNNFTTSDGIAAAVHVLSILTSSSKQLKLFEPYPQISYNVPKLSPNILMNNTVIECIKDMEQYLGDYGRLIVRESGTEAVIRIMAECEDEPKARYVASTIKKVLDNSCASYDNYNELGTQNVSESTLLGPR